MRQNIKDTNTSEHKTVHKTLLLETGQLPIDTRMRLRVVRSYSPLLHHPGRVLAGYCRLHFSVCVLSNLILLLDELEAMPSCHSEV